MIEICENCRFSSKNGEAEDQIQCRRNPPVVFPYSDEGVLKFISAFPTLVLGQSCGRFEPRPAALH